jgi:hypothetical protein
MAKAIITSTETLQAYSAKSLAEIAAEYMAMEAAEAQEGGYFGFMARALVQATMPHSKVNGAEFERSNGNFSLSMLAPSRIGLPYGALPRLIMSWMTTEAVRTKERQLVLGDSLSDFMRHLGLSRTGGPRGDITRLKNQMKRLLACSITCIYDDGKRTALENITPVERADLLWWNPVDPEQKSLWQSTLTLSESFFNEVTTAPIPVRMSTLEALKGSSLALDIYCWLTYRNFYAKRESRIPWEALQGQFGAGYPTNAKGKSDFKRKFLLALKKVSNAYPEALKLSEAPGVLVYIPGMPDISPVEPSKK